MKLGVHKQQLPNSSSGNCQARPVRITNADQSIAGSALVFTCQIPVGHGRGIGRIEGRLLLGVQGGGRGGGQLGRPRLGTRVRHESHGAVACTGRGRRPGEVVRGGRGRNLVELKDIFTNL